MPPILYKRRKKEKRKHDDHCCWLSCPEPVLANRRVTQANGVATADGESSNRTATSCSTWKNMQLRKSPSESPSCPRSDMFMKRVIKEFLRDQKKRKRRSLF